VFGVLGIANGGEVIANLPNAEKMTLIFSPNESDAINGQSLLKPDTASRIASDVANAHRAETQQENWLHRRAVAAFDSDINEETYQRMINGATQLWEEAVESEG
jgi:hypothetical protein